MSGLASWASGVLAWSGAGLTEDGEDLCFRAPSFASFDAEGFLGVDPVGFSGSRCNIFFRLLRIDLENFSAMTDPTRGLGAPFYYIGRK